MSRSSFDPVGTYVQLKEDGHSSLLKAAAVWANPELGNGLLVGVFDMDRDWDQWEVHPAGDEIVLHVSGRIDFVLDRDDGEQVVELRDGRACVVPRGVWHRAVVREPGRTLHITPCEGNEHRRVE